jgi:hypothetical protein
MCRLNVIRKGELREEKVPKQMIHRYTIAL